MTGCCLTSASPHCALTWPAWTATFRTKTGTVLCVHSPPEYTQWEIVRTQEKPLGLMGGMRANLSKALSFTWRPRKKKPRVPLSQKSRSEVFKPCPGIWEVGLQPLPAMLPPNSCIVTGPLLHTPSTTQPVERYPLPCPRTLITRAFSKDWLIAGLSTCTPGAIIPKAGKLELGERVCSQLESDRVRSQKLKEPRK